MLALPVKQRSSEVIEVPRWVASKTAGANALRNSSRFKELREISKKRKNEEEQDSNTRSASLNETIKVWGRLVDDSKLHPQRTLRHSSRLLTQRPKRRPRAGTSPAQTRSPSPRPRRRPPPPSAPARSSSFRRCRPRLRSRPNSKTSSPRRRSPKSPPRDIATRTKRESPKTFHSNWRPTARPTSSPQLATAARGSDRRSSYSRPVPTRKRARACRCRCCGDAPTL